MQTRKDYMTVERFPLDRIRSQQGTLAGAMAKQTVKHEDIDGNQVETRIDDLPHDPRAIATAVLDRLVDIPNDISAEDGVACIKGEYEHVLDTRPKDSWRISFSAGAVAHDALVQAFLKTQNDEEASVSEQITDDA